MDKIYLAKPHVTGNEAKYLIDALESNWIAPLGPYVNKLEDEIETYLGEDKHCVLMSTGTSAIHIALHRIGVSKGDVVLCSSFTFVGSCNPILYLGAEPVFLDCEEDTWSLCPKSLSKAVKELKKENKNIKALICVDLFGISAEYDEIVKICDENNIAIIEDSAEALGSSYKNQKCGTFGDYGIFSFNGNKIITTSGGGALICNSKEEADKVTFLITQARDDQNHYEHSELGFNYRLSNISAAIGLAQFENLNDKIFEKKRIFEIYKSCFEKYDNIKLLEPNSDRESNYWLSCVTISTINYNEKEKIFDDLRQRNIEARHVWKPMHMQPLFDDTEYFFNEEDVSKRLFNTSICLPSSCDMTNEQVIEVANVIIEHTT
ncbi:MAG: hypothetical protein BM556_08875 [Bacteriovorax sp. MedPE-SWde]|nr:MAG: hypothetical protein BM556_08875 [Bacteriovorax sp. MedPE-SWde]